MNSDAKRLILPRAPKEYDQRALSEIINEIKRTIDEIQSPGPLRVNQIVNINNIPTSSSGLRSGDVWSNSGVLTIVS